MSLVSLLRGAAARAALAATVGLAVTAQAPAQQCAGGPSMDFRALQAAERTAAQFMSGTWQVQSTSWRANSGGSTVTFDTTGTYTFNQLVCSDVGPCAPQIRRGLYAAYSLNAGAVSIAFLDPSAGCSVMHLRVVDADSLTDIGQHNTWRMRRISAASQG